MSVATEISRITSNRNTIRNKLVNFGLAESTATLNDLATTIDAIVNRGTVNAEVQEGQSYTIQAGYYQGGTVSGVSGGGNYTLQSKTITPTKAQQNITPDSGYYGLNSVTVNPIPAAYQDVSAVDATAADVLANKVIVAADGTITTGTMTNNGAVDVTLDKDNRSYTVPAGYHNGLGTVVVDSDLIDTTDADAVAGEILSGKTAYVNGVKVTGTMVNNSTVSITLDTETTSYTVLAGYHTGSDTVSITLEQKTVTPTTSAQVITPTAGKVLSQVTVNAIPSEYVDVSDADAVAANILAGKYAYSYDTTNNEPVKLTGTMVNNGAIAGTFDGLTTTSYTVPAGYTSGGTVSLTNDIETALAAI